MPSPIARNWSEEWKQLQRTRRAADDSSYWDERSKTYRSAWEHSSYATMFLDYLDLGTESTLLDMGCGNGAIAIPAAREGNHVIAADFSNGMLGSLRAQAKEIEGSEGVRLDITTKHLSWDEDWHAAGIEDGCVEVAIASRSIATSDLRESLLKLTHAASKRCAVTLPVGSSPRADLRILRELGFECRASADFAFAFMILLQEGYLPEVRYIITTRDDAYGSIDEAKAAIRKMVEHSVGNGDDGASTVPGCGLDVADACGIPDEEELERRIDDWAMKGIVAAPTWRGTEDEDPSAVSYRFETPRQTYWAYISWDVVPRDRL